jgi:hypothetical protein
LLSFKVNEFATTAPVKLPPDAYTVPLNIPSFAYMLPLKYAPSWLTTKRILTGFSVLSAKARKSAIDSLPVIPLVFNPAPNAKIVFPSIYSLFGYSVLALLWVYNLKLSVLIYRSAKEPNSMPLLPIRT